MAGKRLMPASLAIRDDFSISSPCALGRRFEEAKRVFSAFTELPGLYRQSYDLRD